MERDVSVNPGVMVWKKFIPRQSGEGMTSTQREVPELGQELGIRDKVLHGIHDILLATALILLLFLKRGTQYNKNCIFHPLFGNS